MGERPCVRRVLAAALLLTLALALACLPVQAAPAWAQAQASTEELMRRGRDAMAEGRLQEAMEAYAAVPSPDKAHDEGEYASARMQLARLRLAAGDHEGAMQAARDVLEHFAGHAEAQNFIVAVERDRLPAWERFLRDCWRFLPSLLSGAGMTLLLVFCTMLISPLGGLVIALGRLSSYRALRAPCWFVIWLFRGTPLLLQLFFIYYGLPSLGVTLKPLTAALIGLGINYSAYLAEIIRAGIESIPSGQMEAAKALGMTYSQAMRRVVVPQTYKRLIPPVANEFIALIKDTALVSTIAMVELMRAADQMFNTYFNVTAIVLAGVIYLFFTTVFTFVFERIETRVGIYERR
ncbi:L-cystine transport system permease protein YecS [Fundidesulfovibrio magnetotacticus]|uniref:Glutamate/aspartate import permease protein GltK n=1 Tax=Fundidesulfovibrio magnetotacticus TaxID=2730080 RepID=A0A6V8LTV9_9BACT|nr:amino acid ABC transporter permease [Fundidesulfovibrio magnetotacticus]GFK93236.1 L-cystine transport system permease protein YecS [Fundidesulfovibrio magnetotacticus]